MSDWRTRALCARLDPITADAHYFGEDLTARLDGLDLCRSCPVRVDCGEAADHYEGRRSDPATLAGTWGGETAAQRAKRRRSDRRQRAAS